MQLNMSIWGKVHLFNVMIFMLIKYQDGLQYLRNRPGDLSEKHIIL